ncbi:MAG: hypothetical protein MI864_03075 [Pseudomonadales bacterium]|uniref:Uncharacterized protein n=1 Tax=Oleiphilus messinensis TaxID=141451 RepID=A0A1Y0I1P1_9GAMM|nr:hypothetical protein [Oleiphilus messinensis]ARU54377.1 hypothetical protein OLMES_0271 [Oleiphilus messinensis]MCG8609495.1 hypothetical protein [Pseudomonadales bacterium]
MATTHNNQSDESQVNETDSNQKLPWEEPMYIVKDLATETMGKVPGVGEPTVTTGS